MNDTIGHYKALKFEVQTEGVELSRRTILILLDRIIELKTEMLDDDQKRVALTREEFITTALKSVYIEGTVDRHGLGEVWDELFGEEQDG